ncbi:MAG: hypothetical protein ACM3NV_01660 [Syntrophothermus sp.]
MRRLPRPSYANVVSTLALFIALGGAAYATAVLPKDSVGTKQLKNNAVTAAKLGKEAVTTAKIKNGAVTGAKVRSSTLGTVPNATNARHSTSADTASALIPPEAVHYVGTPGEPPFESGYTNSVAGGQVGFYGDHECLVHLTGTAEGESSKVVFTLPLAARPPQPVYGGIAVSGPKAGTLKVETDGRVLVYVEGGTGIHAYGLDGVTFRAASC